MGLTTRIPRRDIVSEPFLRHHLRVCPPYRHRWGFQQLRPILGRLVALLALAGYLLFAHGCHGDEDNELFNAVRTVFTR